MFIYRVVEALHKKKVDYAIAGGFAVTLHGAPRGTLDIDIVLRMTKQNLVSAASALRDLGLRSRLPLNANEVFNFREEYIKNKNLVAWTFTNPDNASEIVDLIIAFNLGDMSMVKLRSGNHTLRVVSVKDLIAMKKMSGRPQDMEDIRVLKELHK